MKRPIKWHIANIIAVILFLIGLCFFYGEMTIASFCTIVVPGMWIVMSISEWIED